MSVAISPTSFHREYSRLPQAPSRLTCSQRNRPSPIETMTHVCENGVCLLLRAAPNEICEIVRIINVDERNE